MTGTVRERLIAAAAVRTLDVKIGGETFTVRELSIVEAAQYGALTQKDRLEASVFLLSSCVIDDKGRPALDAEAAALVARSSRATRGLITAVLRASGLLDDDDDAEGAPEKEPVAG